MPVFRIDEGKLLSEPCAASPITLTAVNMVVLIEPNLRLFVDIEGTQLVPDGPKMREKPTLILIHGGPGPDHSAYRGVFFSLEAQQCLQATDNGIQICREWAIAEPEVGVGFIIATQTVLNSFSRVEESKWELTKPLWVGIQK